MGQPAEYKIDSTKNNLDEIIITATKTERILSSLPLNVSIIKKSDIEKTSFNPIYTMASETMDCYLG